MTKVAGVCVVVLFVLEMLLITALLLLHINMWIGKPRIYGQSGQAVLLAAFLAYFPAAVFAKDRNIWRNEFKSWPPWVRLLVLTCVFYGIKMHSPEWCFFYRAGCGRAFDHFGDSASHRVNIYLRALLRPLYKGLSRRRACEAQRHLISGCGCRDRDVRGGSLRMLPASGSVKAVAFPSRTAAEVNLTAAKGYLGTCSCRANTQPQILWRWPQLTF
jgi:hypothetical protein